MTRGMSGEQYAHFCNARRVSFGSKQAPHKFRDWLLFDMGGLFGDIKPDALALEIFQYLAFETVAQVRTCVCC